MTIFLRFRIVLVSNPIEMAVQLAYSMMLPMIRDECKRHALLRISIYN